MTKECDVFIGSYGTEAEETIHWLTFNYETKQFTRVSAVTGIDNPSFVIVNNAKTHVYAISEVDEGEVVSYAIDYESRKLRELNRQPTKGGPCFVEIDEHDQYLFTTNYGGGSMIVHPINDNGKIGEFSDFHKYDSSERTSHPHAIKNIPGTSKYVVTDLGHDKVYVYEHQSGKLSLTRELKVAKDAGPRHIAFKPSARAMYVINQDNSTITVYTYDEKAEEFELRQMIPALLESFQGTNYSADIHVSRSFLYVSNRGHHSITAYKIVSDGRLEAIANIPSGGNWPRHFNIAPDDQHVIVANEQTNNLVVMEILAYGQLENTNKELSVSKPVCICFV